jgi:hypothetical protein
MLSSNVLRSLRGLLTTSGRRARKWMEGGPRRQPTRQARLGLEILERREVPATYSPVVSGIGGYFGLSATGQVYEKSGYFDSWSPITGSNTKATALVAAEGGHVFMLASNGALNQTVYEYSGSGTDWGQGITGSDTYVTALASAGYSGDLFMLGTATPGPQTVYKYSGSGIDWGQGVTPSGANPTALVANGGSVYMLASYGGAYQTVYAYSGSQWSALTGGTHATALLSFGGNLYMLGSNGPNYQSQTAWQYSGSPYNWAPLTGSDTQVDQLVHGSDDNLYMVATKNYSTGVYQYSGSGTNWGTPLTGASLQNALAAWPLILGHPLLPSGQTYSPANGTLFNPNNGLASYLDVQQQAAGDCWLMASLAETAARAPADISSMFVYDGTTTENGSTVGVYSVRFYDAFGDPGYFTVDTELPGGGSIYDRPVGGAGAVNGAASPVLWAALAEKAYAEASAVGFVTSGWEYSNTYASLGSSNTSGGWPEWALQAITGNSATAHYAINPTDIDAAWGASKLVVLCTPQTPGTSASSYIVSNHCYAVVNCWNTTGDQYFEIFNPWGTDSATPTGWAPGNYGTRYGLAWVDAAFLSNNFSSQAFGVGAAQGGQEGRHAGSSHELADLAFIADLLDPHSKARRGSGVSPTSAVSVN